MDRPICGAYNKLITDLLNTDESSFRNFVRMDLPVFEELLSRVEFALTKKIEPAYVNPSLLENGSALSCGIWQQECLSVRTNINSLYL